MQKKAKRHRGGCVSVIFNRQPVNIFLRCMNPIFVVVVGVQYFREVQVVFSLMVSGCVVAKIRSDPWNIHLRWQDNRNSIINGSCEAYGDPCVNSKEKEEEGERKEPNLECSSVGLVFGGRRKSGTELLRDKRKATGTNEWQFAVALKLSWLVCASIPETQYGWSCSYRWCRMVA